MRPMYRTTTYLLSTTREHKAGVISWPMTYWDAHSKQALLKVNSHQIDDEDGNQTGRHDALQPCVALVWANQLADKAASVGLRTDKTLQLQDVTTPPDV
jgi:hypothetical protein